VFINYCRATVEHNGPCAAEKLPPIIVTIANNPVDFVIRISDRGGGIRHDLTSKIWDYGFSGSSGNEDDPTSARNGAGGMFEAMMDNRAAGSMFG